MFRVLFRAWEACTGAYRTEAEDAGRSCTADAGDASSCSLGAAKDKDAGARCAVSSGGSLGASRSRAPALIPPRARAAPHPLPAPTPAGPAAEVGTQAARARSGLLPHPLPPLLPLPYSPRNPPHRAQAAPRPRRLRAAAATGRREGQLGGVAVGVGEEGRGGRRRGHAYRWPPHARRHGRLRLRVRGRVRTCHVRAQSQRVSLPDSERRRRTQPARARPLPVEGARVNSSCLRLPPPPLPVLLCVPAPPPSSGKSRGAYASACTSSGTSPRSSSRKPARSPRRLLLPLLLHPRTGDAGIRADSGAEKSTEGGDTYRHLPPPARPPHRPPRRPAAAAQLLVRPHQLNASEPAPKRGPGVAIARRRALVIPRLRRSAILHLRLLGILHLRLLGVLHTPDAANGAHARRHDIPPKDGAGAGTGNG
ncbi:hypothetical protein DFH09DRAFT_83524 [Mycena vulgaris]|nr:hypothetical protein DFH09DRAFT_83524 [Mycena vulgaris]